MKHTFGISKVELIYMAITSLILAGWILFINRDYFFCPSTPPPGYTVMVDNNGNFGVLTPCGTILSTDNWGNNYTSKHPVLARAWRLYKIDMEIKREKEKTWTPEKQ